jgi:hypothetical protein
MATTTSSSSPSEQKEESCIVCYESTIDFLPCFHRCCKPCEQRWLSSKEICPKCEKFVPKDYRQDPQKQLQSLIARLPDVTNTGRVVKSSALKPELKVLEEILQQLNYFLWYSTSSPTTWEMVRLVKGFYGILNDDTRAVELAVQTQLVPALCRYLHVYFQNPTNDASSPAWLIMHMLTTLLPKCSSSHVSETCKVVVGAFKGRFRPWKTHLPKVDYLVPRKFGITLWMMVVQIIQTTKQHWDMDDVVFLCTENEDHEFVQLRCLLVAILVKMGIVRDEYIQFVHEGSKAFPKCCNIAKYCRIVAQMAGKCYSNNNSSNNYYSNMVSELVVVHAHCNSCNDTSPIVKRARHMVLMVDDDD